MFEAAEFYTWPVVFAMIAEYQPDALLQLTNATFASNPAKLAALAIARRLPVIYGEREFVDAGGLMSYGISFSDQWRRAAGYGGQNPQRCGAGRVADRAADQVRICDKS